MFRVNASRRKDFVRFVGLLVVVAFVGGLTAVRYMDSTREFVTDDDSRDRNFPGTHVVISGNWGQQYLRVKMGALWLGLMPVGDPIPEGAYVYLEKAYEHTDASGVTTWIYTMDGTLTWSATNFFWLERYYSLYYEGPPEEWYHHQYVYMLDDVSTTSSFLVAFFAEDDQDDTWNFDDPWWDVDVTEYLDPHDAWELVINDYVFTD